MDKRVYMPRQPRLDVPDTLHHVMGRGSEKTVIFRSRHDREDFISQVARFFGVTTSAIVRAAAYD